jgi:predicted nucleic acid-binding protein
MTVLVDTDVLLDLILDREPHAAAAAAVIDRVQTGAEPGYVAWHTVANLYYLIRPGNGHQQAVQFIGELADVFGVAPTTSAHLKMALDLPLKDFEDALQVGAALSCAADVIVTRNTRDFRGSPVPALRPADYLRR